MKKRDNEKEAIMALCQVFEKQIELDRRNGTKYFNMDYIEGTIRQLVENPMSSMNLSNYHRLKDYFREKYFSAGMGK